jgi:hypothetical protein
LYGGGQIIVARFKIVGVLDPENEAQAINDLRYVFCAVVDLFKTPEYSNWAIFPKLDLAHIETAF